MNTSDAIMEQPFSIPVHIPMSLSVWGYTDPISLGAPGNAVFITKRSAYNSTAPATTPSTPAAEPIILKFVATAPEPEEVLLALPADAELVFVASATLMPKPVLVSTVVDPPLVTVVVMTDVAVVEAVQAVHDAHVGVAADVQPNQSFSQHRQLATATEGMVYSV